MAYQRLVEIGIIAFRYLSFFFIFEFFSHELGFPGVTTSDRTSTKVVAETVQHFITLMDSLRLNLVAIDDIQPLLRFATHPFTFFLIARINLLCRFLQLFFSFVNHLTWFVSHSQATLLRYFLTIVFNPSSSIFLLHVHLLCLFLQFFSFVNTRT